MTNPLTVTAPAGLPFIEVEREFDYPVEAVFKAHSDPELFQQWIGPRGYGMELEEFECRTGGRYRFVHTNGEGGAFAFNGVFHVVRDNEFVIQTFEYEGAPDVVSIESNTFESLDGGRCRIKIHSVYPSVESRDAMVDSGMEQGMSQGYEQLDELLAS